MKTLVQIKFDNVLKKGFYEVLKPLGFKKKNNNFYLQLSDVGQIINVQKSSYSDSGHILFTINFGVFEPKFWLGEYDYKGTGILPIFPTEPDCLIRRRIGEMKGDKDIWYEILENTNEEELIEEMQKNIHQYILPFFESLNSVEKIGLELENIWVLPMYKIIFYAENGLQEKAKKVYNELLQGEVNEYFLPTLKKMGKKYHL